MEQAAEEKRRRTNDGNDAHRGKVRARLATVRLEAHSTAADGHRRTQTDRLETENCARHLLHREARWKRKRSKVSQSRRNDRHHHRSLLSALSLCTSLHRSINLNPNADGCTIRCFLLCLIHSSAFSYIFPLAHGSTLMPRYINNFAT